MMEDFGYVLSGPRRGAALSGDALREALLGEELAWAHLTFSPENRQDAIDWITQSIPGLDPLALRALIGDGTRPRAATTGQGTILLLRDTPEVMGDEADDMPSIRLYLDPRMIITLSRRPSRSLLEMERISTTEGSLPATTGAFLHDLAHTIADNAEDLIEGLTDRTDRLEDEVDAADLRDDGVRQDATYLRRSVLALRRYLAPQRDALDALRQLELVPKGDRRRLAEIHDRNVRLVEELDLLTTRLILVREAITGIQSERLNKQVYILSIVSILFLPLTFLTGLLGINVGGIPGAGDPAAFWIVCGLLGLVVAGLGLLLWRIRWL